MKFDHKYWPALLACMAIACRSDRRTDSATPIAEHHHESVPAIPIARAPSAAKETTPNEARKNDSVVAVPAIPILPAQAQSPTPVITPIGSRAERLSAIEAEHEKALEAFYDLYRNAKTDEERQRIADTVPPPDTKPFAERVRALIAEDAKDVSAFHALKWLLKNRTDDISNAGDLKMMELHHFDRPEMVDVLQPLQYARDPASVKLLAKLAEKSPHRNVRGQAWMARAEVLEFEASMSEQARELPPGTDRDQFIEYVGQAEFDRLVQLDLKATEAGVIAIYERVLLEYADVPASRTGTIGDQARSAIHELKNLAVGKTAPDIVGEDIAGVAFKLSDYRGKVVMLDFWGHW